jgi:hypothetical protein
MNYATIEAFWILIFLVPMLQRGNAYHMGSHAGAWKPGNSFSLFADVKICEKAISH